MFQDLEKQVQNSTNVTSISKRNLNDEKPPE